MENTYQTNTNEVNAIILEQIALLSEASKLLANVLENSSGFLSELTQLGNEVSKCKATEMNFYEEALDLTFKMTEYIDQLHIEIPALAEFMKQSEVEVKEYQEKLKSMKEEFENTKNLLSEAKEREDSMKKEMVVQANYSAAMGSIMGTMLWKTSKTEDVINTFIREDMIRDFLIVADVTLKSFMDSYDDELPSTDTHEFKFLLSILGTSINISAQESGREVILSDEIGITFVNNILDYLKSIKMPEGRLLKRLSLIFLFNISCICKRGAKLIQMKENAIESILDCLNGSYTSEIHSIVLSLMKALLDEIPSKELCQQIMRATRHENLRNLLENGEESVKALVTLFRNRVIELDEQVHS